MLTIAKEIKNILAENEGGEWIGKMECEQRARHEPHV
jgi:hypothetical protein